MRLNRRQGGLVVFYGDGLVRNLGGERLIFSRIGQRTPMMEPVETVELPEVPRERKRGFDLQRGFSEVYHAQDSGELTVPGLHSRAVGEGREEKEDQRESKGAGGRGRTRSTERGRQRDQRERKKRRCDLTVVESGDLQWEKEIRSERSRERGSPGWQDLQIASNTTDQRTSQRLVLTRPHPLPLPLPDHHSTSAISPRSHSSHDRGYLHGIPCSI